MAVLNLPLAARRRGCRLPVALPGHLILMLLKILLAALRPAQRQLHRGLGPRPVGGVFRALIECHDDVGAQPDLSRDRALGAEKMRSPIQMRAKSDTLLGDFPKLVQAKNLEASRIRQNRPR